jgi:two-component system chemotaxis response regulator CheB
MGSVLAELARTSRPESPPPTEASVKMAELEVGIAAGGNAFEAGMMKLGTLSALTCPECHGALVKLTEDALVRYRCHTGHAYSPSALFSGMTEEIEATFSQVTRALEECVMLLEDTAQHFERLGEENSAAACHAKAKEIEARAHVLQRATHEHNHFGADVQGGNGGGGLAQ